MSSANKSEVIRLVLLEDDPMQAEWLASCIWEEDDSIDIRYYDSEFSLLEDLEYIVEWNPHVALLDYLVRYFSPEDLEEMEEFPEFTKEPEPMGSGLRVGEQLKKKLLSTEIAIVTVFDLDQINIPEHYPTIRKGDKEKYLEKVMSFIKGTGYKS